MRGFIFLLFFLQVVHFVYMMWHQCTVDIFFMDWERPKGVLLSANQNTDTTDTADTKDGVVTSVPTRVPVSIWRTYFVANEWNEIQSLRKINHTLLLALVLLFIQVWCWTPTNPATLGTSQSVLIRGVASFQYYTVDSL